MAYIFIHGLGQTPESWNKVISNMSLTEKVMCPNLPVLVHGQECNYKNLYAAFCRCCETESDGMNLCGLSLGGILALNYAPKEDYTKYLLSACQLERREIS